MCVTVRSLPRTACPQGRSPPKHQKANRSGSPNHRCRNPNPYLGATNGSWAVAVMNTDATLKLPEISQWGY